MCGRAASDAPRENFAEKHPFHLFRPKTRVKTAGNKHEAIWINRPFYGIVYRSLRQRARVFWLEVFIASSSKTQHLLVKTFSPRH